MPVKFFYSLSACIDEVADNNPPSWQETYLSNQSWATAATEIAGDVAFNLEPDYATVSQMPHRHIEPKYAITCLTGLWPESTYTWPTDASSR